MSIIRDSLVTEEEQLISTKGRGDWREEMTSILSFKKKSEFEQWRGGEKSTETITCV